MHASAVARRTTRAGFYFSAEISDISAKTGFTGYNRYFINTERFFSVFTNYVSDFRNFDELRTNLQVQLANFGRYLLVFRPVFLETGYIAAYRYFSPNEKKKTLHPSEDKAERTLL
jgi:hypothetical protein